MREIAETLTTLPMPILVLLLIGLVMWSRRGMSFVLMGGATVAFLGLSMPMTAAWLERPLSDAAPRFDPEAVRDAVAIVVPTAGVFADSQGGWWPSSGSVRRAVAGQALAERTGLPMVLIGGSPRGEAESEAVSVASQLGLTGPMVLVETDANNSSETATAARTMADRLGGSHVVLVTSPAHVARMAASLRHAGLEVSAHASAPILPPRQPLGALAPYLPSAEGLSHSRAVMHEYIGILWYLLNGDIAMADLELGR
jgi:uncharacterized SAM-binding protein YcdF (DUF218 family)